MPRQQLIALRLQHIELLQSGPAAPPDELELITVADAARLLSFDPRTVHRLRVQRASIRSYIERHRNYVESSYGSKHR